jgi:hypothetical protein
VESTSLTLGQASSSVLGDTARGYGQFFSGLGEYNLNTGCAAAIIAERNRQTNEYLWQCQQLRNQAYRMLQRERRERINATRSAVDARLRNAPQPYDIRSGDALNAVLAILSDPMVYVPSLHGASKPVDVEAVRAIPLRYAAGGVTITLNELARHGAPEAFRTGVIVPAEGEFEAYMRRLDSSPRMTLGELIVDLHKFDLWFGTAETPKQRAIYEALYPRLASLRDELNQGLAARGLDQEPWRRVPGCDAPERRSTR